MLTLSEDCVKVETTIIRLTDKTMSTKYAVINSSVFVKIFLNGVGRDHVIQLLQYIGDNEISVVCPDIFVYEVLSVAVQNRFLLADALRIIRASEKSYLTIIAPTAQQFELAIQITEDGNQKSGFPSIYDSTYHAIAISYNDIFITADKRHAVKAMNYGHIAVLHNWESAFAVCISVAGH